MSCSAYMGPRDYRPGRPGRISRWKALIHFLAGLPLPPAKSLNPTITRGISQSPLPPAKSINKTKTKTQTESVCTGTPIMLLLFFSRRVVVVAPPPPCDKSSDGFLELLQARQNPWHPPLQVTTHHQHQPRSVKVTLFPLICRNRFLSIDIPIYSFQKEALRGGTRQSRVPPRNQQSPPAPPTGQEAACPSLLCVLHPR